MCNSQSSPPRGVSFHREHEAPPTPHGPHSLVILNDVYCPELTETLNIFVPFLTMLFLTVDGKVPESEQPIQ